MTTGETVVEARDLGVAACGACGALCRREDARARLHCRRCHAPLRLRKPQSLTRTWALLLAATILYFPANLLPIMQTTKLVDTHDSTILSGVFELWRTGSWDVAVIVFAASIVVPVFKIVVLAVLTATTQLRSTWEQRHRAQLYRIIEFIGYWSMLDVFVVALLAALVQLEALAQVMPRPGAVAFGAVVILTMLASMSFDPRLIWDTEGSA